MLFNSLLVARMPGKPGFTMLKCTARPILSLGLDGSASAWGSKAQEVAVRAQLCLEMAPIPCHPNSPKGECGGGEISSLSHRAPISAAS